MAMNPDIELLDVIASLGADERAVLIAIAKRLAHGARVYGTLDAKGDPRNWHAEAAEEACDLAVYLCCDLLRKNETTKGTEG